MYFLYAPELNPPQWLHQTIVDEIDNNLLMQTSMSGGYKYPLETLLKFFSDDVEAQDHFKNTYDTNQIYGHNLRPEIESQVYNHYKNFLDTVPDSFKMSLVQICSSTDSWKIHIDNLKTASMFCLIKNTKPARTTWWEPKQEFENSVREKEKNWRNKKGAPIFKHKCVPKAAMWADVGEMILFDNNSAHSIDEIEPNSDRYILTFGFTNINHNTLIECYLRWKTIYEQNCTSQN
jgi:hypothetical protein